MNRLELCQRIRQEAGIGGSGPVTTLAQTGELKRVVDWCDSAWQEIQKRHKWDWMWQATTVTIGAGTYFAAGTIAADRYVKEGTYRDGTRMDYLPWAVFRERYPVSRIDDGTPTVWTIRPDKAFAVNAMPAADQTIDVERYTNPVALTADASIPGMPEEHHMAIVWKALLLYANFEEAGVTRATAQEEYRRHLSELGMSELPDCTFGEALA